MLKEGCNVNKEYEKLFGSIKRVNLFDTEAEYDEVRQSIIDQPQLSFLSTKLPFEGIELSMQVEQTRLKRKKKDNNHKDDAFETEESIEVKQKEESPSRHYFLICEKGVCTAKGYYNLQNKYFYICKGSLVSYETDLFFMGSIAGKMRQNFLNKICEEEDGYYRVVRDAKCRSASAAASYVLGYQADQSYWKDSNGRTISEVYPQLYFPNVGKVESSVEKHNSSNRNKVSRVGRPPRYFYISRDDNGNRSCYAKGMYDKINDKFIIMEGSKLALEVTSSYRFTASDILRNKFIKLNCSKTKDEIKLNRDAICNSPNEAANFVVGDITNGWIEWKSKEGIPLEEYNKHE